MVRPPTCWIAQLPGSIIYGPSERHRRSRGGEDGGRSPAAMVRCDQGAVCGNAAPTSWGTNDSAKLNVFTSRTLGMAEATSGISPTSTSMIHEDLAKANGLKVGDTLTLKANAYDADNNESHSTATVKTTIVGIFQRRQRQKGIQPSGTHRQHHLHRSGYPHATCTSKDGKEIYQDATFSCPRALTWKTMDAAKKPGGLEQLSDHAQRPVFIEHAAARGVRP